MDRRTLPRRGAACIYVAICMIGLLGFSSLGVEVGRVQLVKTELQQVAESAARAGAAKLTTWSAGAVEADAARAAAVSIAAMLNADGTPVVLQSASDVEVGNWDDTKSPVFSVGRTPLNAVHVTARRTQARGNAVQLGLANAIGIKQMNVTVDAIAHIDPPVTTRGFCGIDRAYFAGIGVLAKIQGSLVSNGDVNVGVPLGILCSVTGDARSYNGTTRKGTFSSISGSTAPLDEPVYYPSVKVPATNNNAAISGYLNWRNDFTAIGTARIPAGTYVVRDLNIVAGVGIDLDGPVTFYVTGSANIAASVNLLGTTPTTPSAFKVRVAKGGSVNFLASLLLPIYMDLYAPDTAVAVNVTVTKYQGRLIGKTLDINVPVASVFVEDLSGADPVAGPSITTVQ